MALIRKERLFSREWFINYALLLVGSLIMELLEIKPASTDGDLENVRGMLRVVK
jgi:hypothetical protein